MPHTIWPQAYRELGASVSRQVQHELALRKKFGIHQITGRYNTNTVIFNLQALTLVQQAVEELHLKIDLGKGPVNVCDIGGGNGIFLYRVLLEYVNPYGNRKAQAHRIKAVLTTLVQHDVDQLKGEWSDAYQLKAMAIELPPANFYGYFDLIVAQNSVFYWSEYPELALLNIYKMLKPDGIALVTVPLQHWIIEHMKQFKQFNLKEVYRNNDTIGLELRKVT